MIKNCIFIFFCLCSIFTLNASAEQTLAFFAGLGTSENINNIVKNKSRYALTTKAAVVGISSQHRFLNFTSSTQLKGEVQLLQHFSIQKCQEITVAPIIRAANIFNTNSLPVHFSIGNGISALVGAEPMLEKQRAKPRRVLNYFLIDLATDVKNKEIFFRWHHRCHLFKTIAPGGTNRIKFLFTWDAYEFLDLREIDYKDLTSMRLTLCFLHGILSCQSLN